MTKKVISTCSGLFNRVEEDKVLPDRECRVAVAKTPP